MRALPADNIVVRLIKRSPHRSSELEREQQPHGQDAAVLERPNAVELAAGHERLRGAISWIGEGAHLHCATVRLRNRRTVHLLVENLGETGWDWHVWVRADIIWARYGLANMAQHAREQAEQALGDLMHADADGGALLSPAWWA